MREKSHKLKDLLCSALDIAEEMCEGGNINERRGEGAEAHGAGYGGEGGTSYPYAERHYQSYPGYPVPPMMGMPYMGYPMPPMDASMGERRGRSAMTGRYTRM